MNTTIRTSVAVGLVVAAAIASLAGCAGTAQPAEPAKHERSLSDVAERRLQLQESSRTDVAERRLWLTDDPGALEPADPGIDR